MIWIALAGAIRRRAQTEVKVVGYQIDDAYLHIILPSNFSHELLHFSFGLFVSEDLLAILGGPDYVIPDVISGMTGVFYCHMSPNLSHDNTARALNC